MIILLILTAVMYVYPMGMKFCLYVFLHVLVIPVHEYEHFVIFFNNTVRV